MDLQGKENIPETWENIEIGKLCDLKNGRAFKPTDWTEDGLKIVRIQNLNNPDASYNHFSGEVRDRFIIETNDLLFAWSGTPGTSFGAHIWHGERAVLNQHIFRVDFDETIISKKYFMYAINQKLDELIQKAHGGVGLRHVTKGKFEETEIPLSPFSEQLRLVQKIDELFSELDNAVESLKTARDQLKVYRQAVLKHAFDGKLTAQWREENKDKLETADQLLARIKRDREARYEQQLEEWKAAVEASEDAGQHGRKPARPKRPKPLAAISADEMKLLPGLPMGWVYARLGDVIDEPKYGTSKKCDYEIDGKGVLRIPNIAQGVVDAADLKFAQFDDDEIETYNLRPGDLLTIRSNGSISLVGKCALISEAEERFLYAGYLIRLRPNQSVILPKYLIAVLSGHSLRMQIERKAKSTSGVNNINSGEIQDLIVPVCSTAEQEELTRELESTLSKIDSTEAEIDRQLQRSESLRQSILKRAFSGQLVEQDPNDEPASVLLARIKAEEPAQNIASKKARKKDAA